MLLQHPRGYPFTSRRLDQWWRLSSSTRSGTELCCITKHPHPIGAYIEVGIPLRSGATTLRGTVIRIRQLERGWETTLSIAPETIARATLLARICALEARLHCARPLARVLEARRRAEDWQRLLRRLARTPALYAALLSSRGRPALAGWTVAYRERG